MRKLKKIKWSREKPFCIGVLCCCSCHLPLATHTCHLPHAACRLTPAAYRLSVAVLCK